MSINIASAIDGEATRLLGNTMASNLDAIEAGLDHQVVSPSITILGDSTSVTPTVATGSARKVAEKLAARYPTACVLLRYYNAVTEDHDNWITIQAGANGRRGIKFGDTTLGTPLPRKFEYDAFPHPGGDLDLRFTVALYNWTVGVDTHLNYRWFTSGQRALRWYLGSGLVDHSQKMTVAASATAEKKTVGQRS